MLESNTVVLIFAVLVVTQPTAVFLSAILLKLFCSYFSKKHKVQINLCCVACDRTEYLLLMLTDRVPLVLCLQCFDTVGWAARRATGL